MNARPVAVLASGPPLRIPAGVTSLWVQLRGRTVIEGREGRLELRRGGWLMLGPDSTPLLRAGRLGICAGVCLSSDTLEALGTGAGPMYPGIGQMPAAELRMAIQLWRRRASAPASKAQGHADLRPLLLLMADQQRGIAARAAHCPGHSPARRQQVLATLQTACLIMHGHTERAVPSRELANRLGMPVRYFSEAFLAAYGCTPLQFGTQVRLKQAARRVRRGEMGVDAAALAIGFKHAGTFLRAFRATLGVSLHDHCEQARR
ncbi:AraC family transcriptional regulator [Stenotrophomonas sp. BIGb0135]|uniref:Helix-turn-helix transcriptional regulator n=1 Tax=Stenotrophomonas nematodicola TaxID=2656746 RepID=A0ABW7D1V1_9GAMM|nr:AraC family transcriptional regulator [Stenotrophomonas sp. BIGb0135]MCS4233314.1 AraC family transcriptional regulator [Stenotrophomonas sp. BIGb0135]